MTDDTSSRTEPQKFAGPTGVGAAVVTFLVAVVMPPLAALVGIAALVVLVVRSRRPLPRGVTAGATGVLIAVACYLAFWAVGTIVDPGDPDSGRVHSPAPATDRPNR